MSTDDSISEDVSSSVALSHEHTSANGGKESEASIISSEEAVLGLAIPVEGCPSAHTVPTLQGFLQAAGGTVTNHPPTSPACNITHKIRNLCLGTEEVFSSGRSLPFINPSSLETLRALVQEIHSSGETDPEVWKNCEGRWLHLFQLVEKQYQEQILAQQDQYQCQIQLIQDEIKALVQLQNRQSAMQAPSPAAKDAPPSPSPSATQPPGASSPGRLPVQPGEGVEDSALAGLLSSGYATMSTWEHGFDPALPGAVERAGEGRNDLLGTPRQQDQNPSPSPQPPVGPWGPDCQLSGLVTPGDPSPPADQPKVSRASSQPLTSWAQRQKRRQRSRALDQGREEEGPWTALKEHGAGQEDNASAAASSNPLPLNRTDSSVSEASGLTYWRLDESDLFHPLPDSFDGEGFVLQQDASVGQSPPVEPKLSVSLREIYQTRQRRDPKGSDWDSLLNSNASSPQGLTLPPGATVRRSEHTSGVTSPSPFSSPSLPPLPQLRSSSGAPISPDSMVLHSHTDTDCTSTASSLPTQPGPLDASPTPRPAPSRGQAPPEIRGSHTCTTPTPQTRRPPRQERRDRHSPGSGYGRMEKASSLEDPVVLSLLRQNLREKHSRHVADLRAYYEAEISALREKLDLVDLPLDLEKSNRILTERCEHLERALTEASNRIRELENKNRLLEKQLAEWPERYDVVSAAVEALQQRLEESKQANRDKEGTLARLKARLGQLEEAVQKACSEADEKEARMRQEHKILQELLFEYESLRKDFEGVKVTLVSTEDKLFHANEKISDLKRVISKMEAQIKQLEHENLAKTRQAAHSQSQPSGAGLFHHPDLLLSPSKRPYEAMAMGLRAESVTGQSSDKTGGRLSPPERETQDGGGARDLWRREGALTPMMRALIQMEETKATEGRALTKAPRSAFRMGRRQPTVGFVERAVREPVQERGTALLRAQRSLSPDGPRSSSLPPRAHRTGPFFTPSKRDTLITPLSAKSSPKRCPTENFSTALGRHLPSEQHLRNMVHAQSDAKENQSSFSHPSPRERQQYAPPEASDVVSQCGNGSPKSGHSSESEGGACLAWEEPGEVQGAPEDGVALSYQAQVQSLADAERLFDELTQEKQQIEAALSRIPGAGARVTLQARLDQVALENRLEKVNRDLGSIRMTLKRFNVLRSSTNI